MNHILVAMLLMPFIFFVLVMLYTLIVGIYRQSKRGRNEPPW